MKIFASILTNRIFFVVFGGFGLLFSLSVTAASQHSLTRDALRAGAEQYVAGELAYLNQTHLDISSMPIDERIEVPKCPSSLVFRASDESLRQSNITVRATCPDNDWYLYLMVRATQVQPVVVLSQSVSPGTVLTEQSLAVVDMDKKTIRTSTFSSVEDVIGARIKRRMRAGQPVVPGQLCFVCKGDSIMISAALDGLEIKTSGVAEQDGNLGDTISVTNSSSRKTIQARVISPAEVSVNI